MKGLKPEVVLEIKPILEKNLDVVILWMALMNQLDWPSFIVQIEGFRDPFFYLLYAFIDQDSFCYDSYTSVRPSNSRYSFGLYSWVGGCLGTGLMRSSATAIFCYTCIAIFLRVYYVAFVGGRSKRPPNLVPFPLPPALHFLYSGSLLGCIFLSKTLSLIDIYTCQKSV